MVIKQAKIWGMAMALLCVTRVMAQPQRPNQPVEPPTTAPLSADGATKLFSPLPPPPPDAPPPSAEPRDFSGTWLASPPSVKLELDSLSSIDARTPFPGPLGVDPKKLTKQALEKRHYAEGMNRKGTPLASDAARCRPMNDIGLGVGIFPAEIIQTSDKIVVLQEEGRTRWVIHMHRDHPQRLSRSFWGDSVGRWEGNTLVVDTIGFNGKAQDTTDTTHVISKLRKLEGGQKLELTVTVEDPQTYLEPVSRTSTSIWHPELQMLEFQCEENPDGAMEGLTPS